MQYCKATILQLKVKNLKNIYITLAFETMLYDFPFDLISTNKD